MSFLRKYELVKKSVPVPAVTLGSDCAECLFCDHVYYSSTNCYYCFDSGELRDSMYTVGGWGRQINDCYFTVESEKCYQCVNCTKVYNSTYLIDCNNSIDCHFSAFLNSCSDCFGSVGLTHKKYCFFNKQLSKAEYQRKLKEIMRESPDVILGKMLDLKKKIPHPASQQANNEQCPYGDYIYNSKSSYWCFHTYYTENSGFVFESGTMNNCWDVFYSTGNPDKGTLSVGNYELIHTYDSYRCAFVNESYNSTNCYYSSYLKNCTDCFGCVGLTNKKYCILNNQLTKMEYERAVKDIKRELGWRV